MIFLRKLAILILLCFPLLFASCDGDEGTPNDPNVVTSRIINVRLRADQGVTYRARFTLDGVTIVSQVSSVVSGIDSIITLAFDGLSLPRGRHVIGATILQELPAPSTYKMTVGVLENDKPVGASGEVTATLAVNGTIEVVFAF